ncbi:DNA segregation ATPase FtsK/SpoIIIE, S-DNA-T family [Evansella caseinilytica]|uniref:DNA segregation ATPase FtsK/SpoIIIE, S-DNA-T family n=1 Tax=Evansella caseinilytica TaxID=1503961 RepID=A0A1H3LZB4_9BACI|nr:DNA translocase FtsK [Evansella caseinilytica]SDY69782.1 DNA segregation ATPase FtsK/SpoIIIE, S-DNA-T family [Evansella caseinilytica]
MVKKRRKKQQKWKKQLTYELTGFFLLIISFITFARLGIVGEGLVQLFRFFLGNWHILLTISLCLFAFYIIFKRQWPNFWTRRLIGIYLFIFALTLISHVSLFRELSKQVEFVDYSVIRNTWHLYWLQLQGQAFTDELGGGMIGALGFALSHFLFSSGGTVVFAIFLIVTSVILITGKSFIDSLKKSGGFSAAFFRRSADAFKQQMTDFRNRWQEWREKNKAAKEQAMRVPVPDQSEPEQEESAEEPIIYHFSSKAMEDAGEAEVIDVESKALQKADGKAAGQANAAADNETAVEQTSSLVVSAMENEHYRLPKMDLLASPVKANQSREHSLLSKNARKLERTLESFGVSAKVTKVHLGPSVTKYEVYPSVGVKVSKIVNLTDDLALALAAKDIRMEAPIPGKSAIGIEVPNQEVALVTLREVLDSQAMQDNDNKLAIALGRDISGDAVIAELNKMPHLLVAGATGSGKSVCINGIIVSILMRSKPHEVKLIMIDPKMVELTMYNGIPHLLSPVVTDPKKASQALKKVVNEMERRYELFAYCGARNIEGYNAYIKRENEQREEGEQHQPLPYIVVIVDELADLMMVASSDVEESITRLAQKARASGIHLIIATQRPSVDVITGVIKANIPSRIAFGVSSSTDSRTILDGNGAEKLLGRGDMLFLPVGANKPTRIQGAFLSDEEVERIVFHCIEQQKAQYAEEMIPQEGEEAVPAEVDDELYDDAVQLVAEMQTASVSMLQRRFRIGYTRAARLIDEMELRGIVGPYEGSKPREVLIAKSEDQEVSNH